MISDAFVTATCDKCSATEDVELTALAGHAWDERNVKRHLERNGWRVDDDLDHCICEECAEAEEEEEASQ